MKRKAWSCLGGQYSSHRQSDSVRRPATSSPSLLQVATDIRSSQGQADTCVLAWFCSLYLISTKQLIHYREKL